MHIDRQAGELVQQNLDAAHMVKMAVGQQDEPGRQPLLPEPPGDFAARVAGVHHGAGLGVLIGYDIAIGLQRTKLKDGNLHDIFSFCTLAPPFQGAPRSGGGCIETQFRRMKE